MNRNEPLPAVLAAGPQSALYAELFQLREQVQQEADTLLQDWGAHDVGLRDRCQNLSHYVALRRRDLRRLQPMLMQLGLSSLGRSEAKVMPTLDAVLGTLSAVLGQGGMAPIYPTPDRFSLGSRRLREASEQLFGAGPAARSIHLMVTLPSEAASDSRLVRDLLTSGMDCARINCGHDDISVWQRMIRNVRDASQATGKPCRICMDLSGPRLRIADVRKGRKADVLQVGDSFLLCSVQGEKPSEKRKAKEKQKDTDPGSESWIAVCDYPDALQQLCVGSEVVIDGGIASCRVTRRAKNGWQLQVTHAPPKGLKLRAEKGLNFPGTALKLPALTERDREDLSFVAKHADLVGYSFVQRPSDVYALQDELVRRGRAPESLGLILKIETAAAVRALPALLVAALARQPVGVLIARGDLAAELGFERLPEIQEELLWLCEAAHVPVIWATQVLDRLVRKGTPTRAEVTDAAAAARAECVMLNKGPYLREALRTLDQILTSMRAHQDKKTAQLAPLPW